MRINQFYHVNHVNSSHEFRPDWRSLRKFGDPEKIRKYIKANDVKYIVLLEDFVGSATQSWKALKFASELDQNIKVLFVPLIIYEKGIKKIENEMNGFANFTLSPVLVVGKDGYIPQNSDSYETEETPAFRKIIENSEPIYDNKKFGYEHMGCLLVMYTNTPTNSLPLIHYESKDIWIPLFNRHHRSKR
jgi:hypothetical protein